MQAVILAAGRGKRLAPVSQYHTKAMAPVAGVPMVQRVMDLVAGQDIHDFVLVVGPDDDEIRRHFHNPETPQGLVRLVDQHDRLGTAHALRMAAPLIDGDFVLSACDNLVPPEHIAALIDAHGRRGATITLSLMPVAPDAVSATGIVARDGERITRIVEKPTPESAPSNISSLPLYVLSREFLPYLDQVQPSPRGEYELQDAFQAVIDAGLLVTGVETPWRRQLTNIGDLLALNCHFLGATPGGCLLHSSVELEPDIVLSTPVRLDARTHVGPRTVIGPNVYCAPGARIGADAIVQNALVLAGAPVAAGAMIRDAIVTPDGEVCRVESSDGYD
jgi:NDP-sugar pyrophosphorylase family protein